MSDFVEADPTPEATLCREIPCAEYRDHLECKVQRLEAKVRETNLQVAHLKAERASFNAVSDDHMVALTAQVTEMQEIVDAAMNENMPRLRAATKAYQDRRSGEVS